MRNRGMKKQIVCGCSILLAICLVSCGAEVQSGQPEPGTAETFGTETVDIFENTAVESRADLQSEENHGDTLQSETVVWENPYAGSMYDLLAEEDVEKYLKGLGMEDVSPVCYYDPKGAPKLKLYYDRETGRGCGLGYEETEDGTDLLGFEISGYESYQWNYYWNFPNPYATQIRYGEDLRIDRIPYFIYEKTTGLEETYTYDSENRLCAYHLRGCVKTEGKESKQEEIFTVSFSYRENGTLQEKEYQFNEDVFGHESVDWNPHYVYDELERLLYVGHGRREIFDACYLVYEGDSMIPAAYLELDYYFLKFVPLAEQDYHNRVNVPRDGVDAFLSQVGLSQQDKFHEYRWHNESSDTVIWSHSDVVLTLYFDPERELGCGYLDYPGETLTDMDGFMFKGCIEIDCKETNPYGVFALYEGDSMDEIHLGNLSPEKLPDVYKYESDYICEYDGERLMRIWMYGTGSDTERFFIYDGDSGIPSYCLNLVNGVTHGATLFKFVY